MPVSTLLPFRGGWEEIGFSLLKSKDSLHYSHGMIGETRITIHIYIIQHVSARASKSFWIDFGVIPDL